jgi:hypothetical protein
MYAVYAGRVACIQRPLVERHSSLLVLLSAHQVEVVGGGASGVGPKQRDALCMLHACG